MKQTKLFPFRRATSTVTVTVTVASALALGLAMASSGGCGLISSDITTIKFALPERSYSFDTAQTGWDLPDASLPSVPCTDAASCCAPATAAGIDCAHIICDTVSPTPTCAFTTVVETPPQPVNLKEQVNELSSINSQSLADVTISKITYAVTRNTLNVALPPFELFVGVDGTMSTASATAKKFGTVPSIPAGTTVAAGDVVLDPVGQQAFVGFAHQFGTPFVFLGRTKVVVPGETPVPKGAVDITIKGQLRAKLSL